MATEISGQVGKITVPGAQEGPVQLLAAAFMGVALGVAAQRVTRHGGSLPWFSSAIGATSVVTGAAALAACCSPMTQVIGTLGGLVTPGVWLGITGGLLGTHLRLAMGVPRKAPRQGLNCVPPRDGATRRSEYPSLPRQYSRRETDGNV